MSKSSIPYSSLPAHVKKRLKPLLDAQRKSNPGRAPAHRPGEMNNTEKLYAAHLDIRRRAGEIVWWGFECMTLILEGVGAEKHRRIRYTPDFVVVTPTFVEGALRSVGLELEFHETKGFLREDARLKFAWARQRYPWAKFYMFRLVDGNFERMAA